MVVYFWNKNTQSQLILRLKTAINKKITLVQHIFPCFFITSYNNKQWKCFVIRLIIILED